MVYVVRSWVLVKKTGVKVKGPTPLPVKRLHVATRKSPCGSGTETYEKMGDENA